VPYLSLAITAGLVSATLGAPAAGAASPSAALAAAEAEASQVLAEINQLNVGLDRADELANLANVRLQQVRAEMAFNRGELAIAERNLAANRSAIASRLVRLYTTGSASTLELILGAQSLGEVINRIDAADRVSAVDAQVAGQVTRFKDAVVRRRLALASENAQVRRLVAERAQQRAAIAAQLGEQQQLLASVNAQVAQLVAAEQAAQEAAALRASQQAAAAAAASQTQASQAYTATPVGASAATPEGASVVPPSGHSGAVGVAMSEVGTPYVWAGSAPGGFDCSGLVRYAYQQVGVSLPHSSYAMWGYGTSVPRDQLQPGDIVFFNGLGHVGIYVGGGQFVHAPHTGTDVQVSSLDNGSYASSYVGARRIT
jgi:cell wall-associated NlpC family hydrolase